MDGISELARLLKERDNRPYLGPQVGVVVVAPPEIKVSLGDNIVLDKEDLIISAHVLADYQRTVTIDQTVATIKTTDTLKAGDAVILIPSGDHQTYYLVDKAVTL